MLHTATHSPSRAGAHTDAYSGSRIHGPGVAASHRSRIAATSTGDVFSLVTPATMSASQPTRRCRLTPRVNQRLSPRLLEEPVRHRPPDSPIRHRQRLRDRRNHHIRQQPELVSERTLSSPPGAVHPPHLKPAIRPAVIADAVRRRRQASHLARLSGRLPTELPTLPVRVTPGRRQLTDLTHAPSTCGNHPTCRNRGAQPSTNPPDGSNQNLICRPLRDKNDWYSPSDHEHTANLPDELT